MAKLQKSLLSLGSNLGDRQKNLEHAVTRIQQTSGILSVRPSHFRSSKPVGGPAGQDPFLNAAVEITTTLDPYQLLRAVHLIEQEHGRERHARWDARTLDIDILTFGQLVISSPDLTIPHPRMTLRRFVLEPVCDLVPQDIHSETGWSYQHHLDHLDTAGNYAIVMTHAGESPQDALRKLTREKSVLVADSLPVAHNVATLQTNYDALQLQSTSDQFVLCNFAPRQCLIEHPGLLPEVQRFEQDLLPPRLLVILTDNIHNESRHQLVTKMMPDRIITPWLFLDNFNHEVLAQELSALATCHR